MYVDLKICVYTYRFMAFLFAREYKVKKKNSPFFFMAASQQMEVPGPGIESEPQLWLKLQLQQCQILYLTMQDQRLNFHLHSDLSHCSQVLNPLCHSGTSKQEFFDLVWWLFIYVVCLVSVFIWVYDFCCIDLAFCVMLGKSVSHSQII